MQIIHKLDDFFYTLFSISESADQDKIISVVKKYFTGGEIQSEVRIDDDSVIIDINTPEFPTQDAELKKVKLLCGKKKYAIAKPILIKMIRKNPMVAEFHRLLAHIELIEDKHYDAMNLFMHALRIKPDTPDCAYSVGKILLGFRDDVQQAIKYFDRAIAINPANCAIQADFALIFMEHGKDDVAKRYFSESLALNPEFANALYGLGGLAYKEGDLLSAFEYFTKANKSNPKNDEFALSFIERTFTIAYEIVKANPGTKIYEKFKAELEAKIGKKVEIEYNSQMKLFIVLELAEEYNRDTHIIKANPDAIAIDYFILHSLVKLDLIYQAKEANLNKLFISAQTHKSEFFELLIPLVEKLESKGWDEREINAYLDNLYFGTINPTINIPIDLFIEEYLYHNYPEFRPYQLVSMMYLVKDSSNKFSNTELMQIASDYLLSISRIYLMLFAMQLRTLYHFDEIAKYKATPKELKIATDFYKEFLQLKDDKQPGIEYELVRRWAETVKIDKIFGIVDEQEYLSNNPDRSNILRSILQ